MSELHFARARDRNYDRNVYNGGMRLCWLCIWICVYYAILMEVNESKTIKCVYIIVECHITVEMIVQNMKFLIYIKENYLKIYIYTKEIDSRYYCDEKRIGNESENWYPTWITLPTYYYYVTHQLIHSYLIHYTGAYTGSIGQVETNWRWNLGKNYRFREKPSCG